jgi:hypothetical protein
VINRTFNIDLRNNRRYFSAVILLLVLAMAARFPQLLGGNLVPNGDESLIGTMAKEVLEGKGLPLFMHGQCYGLSLFETGTAALFFLLFGASGPVLKISMLAFWSLGWILFVAASSLWYGRKASLVTGLLLALMPAWAAFSMYARGGYLTAFLLTGVVFLLAWKAFRGSGRSSLITAALLGACFPLLFLSQPLWVPGNAAAVFLLWFGSGRKRPPLLTSLLSGTLIALPALLLMNSCTPWWQPPVFQKRDMIASLLSLPGRFSGMMSGAYIYHRPISLGPLSYFSGILYAILAAAAIIYSPVSLVKRKKEDLLLPWTLAMILSASTTLFINHTFFGNRYLLPSAAYFPFLAAAAFRRFHDLETGIKKVLVPVLLVTALLSLGAMTEFRDFTYDGKRRVSALTEQQAFRGFLDRLARRKIEHLYVYDPMPVFHWQLIFHGENLTARWFSGSGRVPSYSRLVDAALIRGEPVALTGKIEYLREVREKLGLKRDDPRIRRVSHRYFLLLDPDLVQLLRLGFSFKR